MDHVKDYPFDKTEGPPALLCVARIKLTNVTLVLEHEAGKFKADSVLCLVSSVLIIVPNDLHLGCMYHSIFTMNPGSILSVHICIYNMIFKYVP